MASSLARRSPALAHFGVAGVIGAAGGLMGLGGAEFRLPYLVGVLGFSTRQAVPINLAISLATLLAALPARVLAVGTAELAPFALGAASLAAGAVIAAALGARWLRHLPEVRLSRLVLWLLVLLGAGLVVEGVIGDAGQALIPADPAAQLLAGFALGLAIGLVSSLLGVAGGEVIIPTLVFGFGAPVKAAGSLSLAISLPAVGVGLGRHLAAGALDGGALRQVVAPMALGSAAGAALGGLLVGLVSADALKLVLGAALIWSAWRVFRHQP